MTVTCAFCGKPIPDKVIDARHYSQEQLRRGTFFCDRECVTAANKTRGFYQALAHAGNDAQDAYKAVHGHRPGYERRAQATRLSNQNQPRRQKHHKG